MATDISIGSPSHCVISDLRHLCQTGSEFKCVARDIVSGRHYIFWSEMLMLYYLQDKDAQNSSLSFWIPVEFMSEPLWEDGMLAIETTDLNTLAPKEHLIPLTRYGSHDFNGIPCACFKLGEVLLDNFKCVVRTDTRERIPSFVRFNHWQNDDANPGVYGSQHEVVARTVDVSKDTYVPFFEKLGEHDPNFYVWTDALVEKTPIYIHGSEEYEGVYSPKEGFKEPLALNYPDERIGSLYSPYILKHSRNHVVGMDDAEDFFTSVKARSKRAFKFQIPFFDGQDATSVSSESIVNTLEHYVMERYGYQGVVSLSERINETFSRDITERHRHSLRSMIYETRSARVRRLEACIRSLESVVASQGTSRELERSIQVMRAELESIRR